MHALHVYCQVDFAFLSLVFDALQNRQTMGSEDVLPQTEQQSPEWLTAALTRHAKLQALVYDILPSTTAVVSYVIGSRKVSANEQFFVGARTV